MAVLGDQHETDARAREDGRGGMHDTRDPALDVESVAIWQVEVGEAPRERLGVDMRCRLAHGRDGTLRAACSHARSPTDVAVTPAAPGSSSEGALRWPHAMNDLVVCDGEWDISRADELASRADPGAGTRRPDPAPRLPPGDVRRCQHGRGDLCVLPGGLAARRRPRCRLRARVSCDESSSSLTSATSCPSQPPSRRRRVPRRRARARFRAPESAGPLGERMARAGGRPRRRRRSCAIPGRAC